MLTHRDVLRRNASAYGPRIAITSENGIDLTYAGLEEATNSLANALAGEGHGPGDRLVWLDRNSADFLVCYYATAKLGMTFSALNAWLRPRELASLVELVRPSVVVAGPDFLDTWAEAGGSVATRAGLFVRDASGGDWRSWQEFATTGDSTCSPDVENDEERIHEICFTSGTTGQAKGVMRTQRARILDSAFAALGYELSREDHLIAILPQFHIGGAAVANQLILQGGRVTVLRQYEPLAMAQALAKGVTYIVGVPAHYALLFESGHLDSVDTTRVRGCYVGGSAASPTLFQNIQKHFPSAELVHGYGSTESGPHTMALRGQAFLDHFGSLGLPVAGTEVRVVTLDERDAADDEPGELWVKSDAVMRGYLDRPDLTAGAFSDDGWLKTGDLVRRDSAGWFSLVDRVKDMIITGGENVYPREVEDVIAAFEGVAEVAVVGLPDPLYEERVVAALRVVPGAAPPDTEALRTFVQSQLAGFKVPKQWFMLEDLPRTGNGKVAKTALRAQLEALA